MANHRSMARTNKKPNKILINRHNQWAVRWRINSKTYKTSHKCKIQVFRCRNFWKPKICNKCRTLCTHNFLIWTLNNKILCKYNIFLFFGYKNKMYLKWISRRNNFLSQTNIINRIININNCNNKKCNMINLSWKWWAFMNTILIIWSKW